MRWDESSEKKGKKCSLLRERGGVKLLYGRVQRGPVSARTWEERGLAKRMSYTAANAVRLAALAATSRHPASQTPVLTLYRDAPISAAPAVDSVATLPARRPTFILNTLSIFLVFAMNNHPCRHSGRIMRVGEGQRLQSCRRCYASGLISLYQ